MRKGKKPTGKKPQPHQDVPPGWQDRLEDFCRTNWQKHHPGEAFNLAAFTGISRKTLFNANKNNWFTKSMFATLAQAVGCGTQTELLRILSPPAPATVPLGATQKPTTKLDSSTSKDMERDYVALARDGRHDSAASLAKKAVAGAEAAEDKRLTAHWADRVADAYRAIGLLREASAFYALSWSKAQEALALCPDDMSLRYQIGKTRFGQIMVDDYLMRGAFVEAYSRHAQLMSDVDSLLQDVVSEALRDDIRHRRIHIRRQQAEMLRYLGRYGEALKVIREVLSEYPASAHEPRSYARLSEADSLRLQGNTITASAIYSEVETTARERHLDGLLGAVLWRKACLLQLDGGDGQFDNCLEEVAQLADDHPERYRFMVIYSLLLRASGKVADAKTATGALKKVEKFGPLRPDYLVAEYAHVALCRGELLRQTSLMADALAWFQKAFECYLRMECRWGIVRAWIGVRLSGGDAEFPGNVKRTLEGTDAKLFQQFERNREIEPGILSMNIP